MTLRLRGFFPFWPFVLYVLLFRRLAHRPDLVGITGAAVMAGVVALVTAYVLQSCVRLPARGMPIRKALDFRKWPPEVQRDFGKTTAILCLTVAICMVASLGV